jgi:hypothetical protein
MNLTIKDIFSSFINAWALRHEFYLKIGKATDINETDYTFTFVPNDGTNELTCQMTIINGLSSLVIVPEENSLVLVGYNNSVSPYCIMIETAKKILFNGGENGGLIKIESLKSELDKVNQILDAILQIINGTPIPEPGNGANSALQTALSAVLTGKQTPTYSEIENEKIKH